MLLQIIQAALLTRLHAVHQDFSAPARHHVGGVFVAQV